MLLRTGDHIVATLDIYGGTHRLFTAVLPRYGITTTFVDMLDLEATRNAITPRTKLIYIETPTNPTLKIIDIRAVSALRGARRDIVVAVDNTFPSPFFQRPLSLGADIVAHSTTKYINGHSDVVGGVVITDDEALATEIKFHQNAVGAVPGPWDSYLALRGAKTLALRMREHERNALAVAEYLSTRDDVSEVFYPGLASHPQHALAKAQMSGFGGIVSLRGARSHNRPLDTAVQSRNLARRCRIADLQPGGANPRELDGRGVGRARHHRGSAAPFSRHRRCARSARRSHAGLRSQPGGGGGV
jgi:cystathionine beta-lyase/cystathionine gamma-synthase